MWSFRKQSSASDDSLATIDQGIDFVSHRWRSFVRSVVLPPDMLLRDRIILFCRSIETSLHESFPSLASASDEVMLLIIAKGVERSGVVHRHDIERELGILLPP